MEFSQHRGKSNRERVFLEELRQCGEVAEVKCYDRVGGESEGGADDLPYAPTKCFWGFQVQVCVYTLECHLARRIPGL